MNITTAFNSLSSHPFYKKHFSKLKASEVMICATIAASLPSDFSLASQYLDKLSLDSEYKALKNWRSMHELISVANDIVHKDLKKTVSKKAIAIIVS